MKIQLPVTDHSNFSYTACLGFLGRSDRECLHQVVDGRIYKMMVYEGQPVLLCITEDREQQSLVAEVLYTGEGAVSAEAVRGYVTQWLHLDADLRSFYAFAAVDPVLGPLVARYKGLRLIGIPDLFEALTWTITGQQISLPFAYTLRKRFVTAFGYALEHGGATHYVYPVPEVVTAVPAEWMTDMQYSRGKAAYIHVIAAAMASGQLDGQRLKEMGYSDALQYLRSFKGIGNWSANYVLMKYARFPEALPLEDAGLHNALRRQLALPAKPTLKEVSALTAHWGEHAAYATFYLWYSFLEPGKLPLGYPDAE
ncbi:DNA-3-methyladenine glycosylase 2 [Chitinophaga pendula]|uniref:DNA-3-methyladenine glycosylase 2 n=1 Tax=Chitinophaga TaxID=79328 RepID=UPI000BAF312D|nr:MULTISPECIES: DNA glycosylase [Chitinophaga]ASZ13762.1 DNA-3-methyladenine glycosylase [Chitinophaga sp. MD30]UCJ08618.1 DNA-3-methyladenine glycosylase 2 [Chitinophaga pendula]